MNPDHTPEAIDATIIFIHSRPEILHHLSFLEQRAVCLKAEGKKAWSEKEEDENRNRRERLHNQYGHLVP